MGVASFVDENVTKPTLVKVLELVTQEEPVISVVILKRLLGPGSGPPSEEIALPTHSADEPESPDGEEEAGPNPHLSGGEAAILNALVQGLRTRSSLIGCRSPRPP